MYLYYTYLNTIEIIQLCGDTEHLAAEIMLFNHRGLIQKIKLNKCIK